MHMAPGVSSLVFAFFLGPVKEAAAADKGPPRQDKMQQTQAVKAAIGTDEPPPLRIHSSAKETAGHANMSLALLGMALTWFCSQGVSFKRREKGGGAREQRGEKGRGQRAEGPPI